MLVKVLKLSSQIAFLAGVLVAETAESAVNHEPSSWVVIAIGLGLIQISRLAGKFLSSRK